MRSICETLGINRSTVYYQRQMDEHELRLRDKIEQIAAKYPRYGYRRTSEMLKRDGYKVGYRRVARIMKEEEVYLHEYEDFHDAYGHIGHFLDEVYMRKRPHSSLRYRTPAKFEVESRGKTLLK